MFYLLREGTATVYLIPAARMVEGAEWPELVQRSTEAKHASLIDWKRVAVKAADGGWALYQ